MHVDTGNLSPRLFRVPLFQKHAATCERNFDSMFPVAAAVDWWMGLETKHFRGCVYLDVVKNGGSRRGGSWLWRENLLLEKIPRLSLSGKKKEESRSDCTRKLSQIFSCHNHNFILRFQQNSRLLCSSRRMSDALADFIPLLFSFLFDNDKKKQQQKHTLHLLSHTCFRFGVLSKQAERRACGRLSFHAPLSSLSATVASTPQTLSPQTSH